MNILVTGGTGFLGSYLVRALGERGHTVRCLGRNFERHSERIAACAEPLAVDIRDRAAVLEACRGQDAVFHVAALSAPWGRAQDFYAINVQGTEHVIEGCQAHAVPLLINVSSPSVVFDGSDQHMLSEHAPYPQRWLSPYGATKKMAEERVRAAHSRSLATINIRPKAIFGPGDTTLLPRLITAARAGRLPQIGAGANRVDLTYVENVVHALLLALTAPAAHGKTYTITNNEHPQLWAVIRLVLRELGLRAELRTVPYSVMLLAARAMELAARVTQREPLLTAYSVAILARTQTYDISAAQRDLGYAPLLSLAEGIEHTLAALREEQH